MLFTATFLLEGARRPGYNALRLPLSALSLGAGGWVQVANFIVFGALTCASAPGWRTTMASGAGAVSYPALKVITGVMLITAGAFSQDPGLGYPPGVPTPATVTVHAQIHNAAAVLSLLATISALFVLARRLHREPDWRRWGIAAAVTAVALIGLLGAFGSDVDHAGLAGMFEKLTSITALLFTVAFTVRVLQHHGQLGAVAPGTPEQEL